MDEVGKQSETLLATERVAPTSGTCSIDYAKPTVNRSRRWLKLLGFSAVAGIVIGIVLGNASYEWSNLRRWQLQRRCLSWSQQGIVPADASTAPQWRAYLPPWRRLSQIGSVPFTVFLGKVDCDSGQKLVHVTFKRWTDPVAGELITFDQVDGDAMQWGSQTVHSFSNLAEPEHGLRTVKYGTRDPADPSHIIIEGIYPDDTPEVFDIYIKSDGDVDVQAQRHPLPPNPEMAPPIPTATNP